MVSPPNPYRKGAPLVKHVRTIALAVTAMIGVATIAIVSAQDSRTANVEVRVWQSTSDAESLYISARPEGGSWATLGTIPLDMSGLNSRETFRFGDITVAVPIPETTDRTEAPCAAFRSFIYRTFDQWSTSHCSAIPLGNEMRITEWVVLGDAFDLGASPAQDWTFKIHFTVQQDGTLKPKPTYITAYKFRYETSWQD